IRRFGRKHFFGFTYRVRQIPCRRCCEVDQAVEVCWPQAGVTPAWAAGYSMISRSATPASWLHVRFSNRPSGSSAFRLSTTPVSMSLTGSRFSSDSAPRPFHHGDSKTRWNNLLGDLAVNVTAGSSGHANSPHPSSREGHHSTVGWISGFLLSDLIRPVLRLRRPPWSTGTRCHQP